MMKTGLFAALLLAGVTGAAEAGGQPGSIGVGAEYLLSGTGGASVNYDGGAWHAGGFLGFLDPGPGDATWQVGGRFYYHVHSTMEADFGVGGGLGIANVPDAGGDSATLIFLEPSIQIRAFVVANVALSAETGIVLGLSDADGVGVTGGTIGGGDSGIGISGGVGVHYYFF